MMGSTRMLAGVVAAAMLLPVVAFADSLPGGKYRLIDGQVPFVLDVMPNPDGKMFLVGSGNLPDGRGCRVGDLAEIKGGQLVLGVCTASIAVQDNGFQLSDSQNCFQCVSGLSASGTYKKQ